MEISEQLLSTVFHKPTYKKKKKKEQTNKTTEGLCIISEVTYLRAELVKLTCENEQGHCSFSSTLKSPFYSLSEESPYKKIQVTDTE